MSKPRIIIFDTESSDLYATWGSILCFTWMEPHEKKAHVLRISDFPRFKQDPTDDRDLVRAMKKILDKADMLFGWFSTKHDVPLINSRLIYYGYPPLSPVAHVDGWWIAKTKLRLPSNGLAMVSQFMELPQKTPILPSVWKRARAGHLPSLKYVYQHGLQDTVITKMAYLRLLPLIDNHPNVHQIADFRDGCPKCGVIGKMKPDGHGFAKKRAYRKYQCKACKGYTRGAYL